MANRSKSEGGMWEEQMPVDQPPCETLQFNQETEYLQTTRDEYGNEFAEDRTMHRAMPAESADVYGHGLQYDDGIASGYDFTHGPEDASSGLQKIIVQVDRADRGHEF